MTSTRDVDFEHDELYYILHVSNNKITLMMTLLIMYVLFSYMLSYEHLIHPYQGYQQYSLIKSSESD